MGIIKTGFFIAVRPHQVKEMRTKNAVIAFWRRTLSGDQRAGYDIQGTSCSGMNVPVIM